MSVATTPANDKLVVLAELRTEPCGDTRVGARADCGRVLTARLQPPPASAFYQAARSSRPLSIRFAREAEGNDWGKV